MATNNTPRSFQSWAAIVATPNDFNLDAGTYGFSVATIGAGSATLQKFMPDGATLVAVSAVIVAAGYVVLQVPAGKYRLVVVTGPVTGEIALIARGR